MSKLKKKLRFKKAHLLLTRPMDDSKKLSKKLDSRKFKFYISPMLEIRGMNYKLENFKNFDLFLFTSKNGLRNFKHINKESKAIVIGKGTLNEAKEIGLKNLLNIDGSIKDLKKKSYFRIKTTFKYITSNFRYFR